MEGGEREKSTNKWGTRESGSIENCNFKISSQNGRGLRTDKVKRNKLFQFLKKNGDISFIQETHCTKDTEKQWKMESECDVYFSNGTSTARGVMIMISKTLDIEITAEIKDTEGRFLLLQCKIQGTDFLIYNVYGPNSKNEQTTFLENIKVQLDTCDINEYEYIIGGGDWNLTKDLIDRSGGNHVPWTDQISLLEKINEQHDLIDIWRVRNPEKIRFTWRRRNPIIQSRIDRFYVSDTLQYNIDKTEIVPGLSSDHSCITLSIKSTKNCLSGPSFWKFNNSLLKNEEFTNGLNQYVKNELHTECKEIKSKQVKWEYHKYKIKQWCMKKSKEIARKKREQEKTLIEKIKTLEEKVGREPTEQTYNEMDQCKISLEKIHDTRMQSLIIQSRVQVYEEGEKSTSFFLNQIKQNKRKSTIKKLLDEDQEIVEQKEIMDKLHEFYSRLYDKQQNCDPGKWINKLREKGLIPQLSEQQRNSLEKQLEKDQLKKTLEECAKNKSPGNDGLTQEFYAFFWNTISDTLYESYLESINIKKLSISQRQNIISLLEKAGKDKTYIKNWRPISLINFDTKLLSKTYANRLKEVMPTLVHPNQVAYVKNRFIGEGIRVIDETMEYTRREKLEAYAVAIDFEKAFDSIDWEYLWKALEAFNIPTGFIDMIKLLYKDIESCVINNGTTTAYFKIKRGVRQGDPIAAYLFTLAIELLAINIRENDQIKGIQINNTTIKLSMYADDMTGLVIGINSIKELMKIMEEFKLQSGLGVNNDKTEILPLGISKCEDENLKSLGYKIVIHMKITGVVFTYNKEINTHKNYQDALIGIEKMFNIWKQRSLSIIGKIQIIKTYGITKTLFITNMKNTPADIITKVNTILYNFIWNGPDKVKRSAIIADIAKGGLKMPHLESIIKTQKVIWCKRYAEENYHPWKEFLMNGLHKLDNCISINRKIPLRIISEMELSDFNKEMLICWNKFQTFPSNGLEIGNQLLWYNENITTPNGETLYYQRLEKKHNIKYVRDIERYIKSNENLTAIEQIELNSVVNCLPKKWETTFKPIEDYLIAEKQRIKKLNSKSVYKVIIQNEVTSPTSEVYLAKVLNISESTISEMYSIPYCATIYTKLRSFQFKINHNILYTNEKLYKIGKVESPLCCMCNMQTETLVHLFVECEKINTFWRKTSELLHPYGIDKINATEIILGILTHERTNNITNHIILEAKYYIYVCKLEKTMPNFARFIKRLKITENIEKRIASKSEKSIKAHEYKWSHLSNFILQ